ncbi:MAG: FAD binding domain-containing protein [Caldimonas sp.]
MKEFIYLRPADSRAAIGMMASRTAAKFLGGGTNLVDLMRENIERPDELVDVSRLDTKIEVLPSGGLCIGAGAKNTAVAADAAVRQRFPVLSNAILHASPRTRPTCASPWPRSMPWFMSKAARGRGRSPCATSIACRRHAVGRDGAAPRRADHRRRDRAAALREAFRLSQGARPLEHLPRHPELAVDFDGHRHETPVTGDAEKAIFPPDSWASEPRCRFETQDARLVPQIASAGGAKS